MFRSFVCQNRSIVCANSLLDICLTVFSFTLLIVLTTRQITILSQSFTPIVKTFPHNRSTTCQCSPIVYCFIANDYFDAPPTPIKSHDSPHSHSKLVEYKILLFLLTPIASWSSIKFHFSPHSHSKLVEYKLFNSHKSVESRYLLSQT